MPRGEGLSGDTSRREWLKRGAVFLAGGLAWQGVEKFKKRPAEKPTLANVPETEPAKQPEKKAEVEKKPDHAKVVDLSNEKNEIPSELKGTAHSLNVQNEIANTDGLVRLNTEIEMKRLVRSTQNPNGILVEIPRGQNIGIDPYLAADGNFTYTTMGRKGIKKVKQERVGRKYKRDYCSAWTAEFLKDLARDYSLEFPKGPTLMVSSGVRPKDVQADLRSRLNNFNVSPRSVHPTGAAVDIVFGFEYEKALNGRSSNKRIYEGLPKSQRRWLEGRLILLKKLQIVEPEQEGRQPCYHVVVPRNYSQLVEKNKKDLYF